MTAWPEGGALVCLSPTACVGSACRAEKLCFRVNSSRSSMLVFLDNQVEPSGCGTFLLILFRKRCSVRSSKIPIKRRTRSRPQVTTLRRWLLSVQSFRVHPCSLHTVPRTCTRSLVLGAVTLRVLPGPAAGWAVLWVSCPPRPLLGQSGRFSSPCRQQHWDGRLFKTHLKTDHVCELVRHGPGPAACPAALQTPCLDVLGRPGKCVEPAWPLPVTWLLPLPHVTSEQAVRGLGLWRQSPRSG